MPPLPPLRRHQLAHLGPAGWRQILARDWDAPTRGCLSHWAEHALPLVVTRQRQDSAALEPQHVPAADPGPDDDALVALGLPVPARWGRRPLALQVAGADILRLSEFPTLTQARAVLPRAQVAPLVVLDRALQNRGVRVHVYGSAGWQHLTGLPYLHERSDLDLWLAVDDAEQADAATLALQACHSSLRLDGELMFPDGSAIAWREWAAWSEGRCRQVLVKRLHGAVLEASPGPGLAAWAPST
jgi:phosphoribosyl-dephospho-CoA transferase